MPLFSFLGVFAEKVKQNTTELNSIKWEKIEENKSKTLKKIIWKSYNNDDFYFGNKKEKGSIADKTNSSKEERKYVNSKKSVSPITEIEPFLPLAISRV